MNAFTSPLLLEMTLLNWLLILVLALALPAMSVHSARHFKKLRDEDMRAWRIRQHWQSTLLLWMLCLLAIGMWTGEGRELVDAWLLPRGELWQTILGGIIALIASGIILRSSRSVAADDASRILEALSENRFLVELMPEKKSEFRSWAVLSVTAGITEEIVYRGILVGLLAPSLGLAGAFGISVLVFAAGHLYQDRQSLMKVLLVGAGLSVLVILSGSVWPAVVLHAAIDLASGRTLMLAKQVTGGPGQMQALA